MKIIDLHRCDRGTQIAEFALVLPLLLFISLGIIEGSSFIRVHQIINNAAREGARISTLPENRGNTADIKTAVVTYASKNGITLPVANVTIDQTKIITTASGSNMSASQVTVTYGYPIQWLSKVPFFTVPTTVNLKATAEFANFYGL
jgi:Flp pilus assembly protein TadG